MEDKFYKTKAFAKLTGVTERTLRYYDRIHILKPSRYNEQGHRLYGPMEMHQIQRILTLKYLGYSLTEIKELLTITQEDSFQETLLRQKNMLQRKREEMDYVIQTIEKVEVMLGEKNVDNDILLALIHSIQHEQYHKKMFSNYFTETTVKQAFLEDKDGEEKEAIEQQFISFLKELKDLHSMNHDPGDVEVQQIFSQMFTIFNDILTPQAFDEITNLQEQEKQNLMISYFSPEFETFIAKAFEIYEEGKGGVLK